MAKHAKKPRKLAKARYRLPETVKVGPYTYTVRELPADEAEADNLLGFHVYARLEIAVRIEGMHPTRIAEVFLHELLHACWQTAGLGNEQEAEIEERAVNGLAIIMLGVMRDNPDLLPWVQELLEQP